MGDLERAIAVRTVVIRTRIAAALLIACAGGLAACSSDSTSTVSGTGDAGSPPYDGAGPGDARSDGADPARTQDGGGGAPDGGGGDGATSDAGGNGDASDAGTGDAGPGPDRDWAMWPMPNLPSSGLPNPQSYDTTSPYFVVDKVTGLVWTSAMTAQRFAWADAQTACATLDYRGYDDWRTPTVVELGSIVDLSDSPFGAINTTVFPNATTDPCWTSTFWGDNGGWYIDFEDGAPKVQIITDTMFVRCVRGGSILPDPHYTAGVGTVTDNWTQLVWQQPIEAMTYDLADATQYCADLSLAGHDDWRLPSPWELMTLFDFRRPGFPSVDTAAFPGTPDDNPYWTSSAWGVRFSDDPEAEEYAQSAPLYARCVR